MFMGNKNNRNFIQMWWRDRKKKLYSLTIVYQSNSGIEIGIDKFAEMKIGRQNQKR